MLTTLSIENFAIVKKLQLDFYAGMTALTGETGVGKSIMIDALMLALGARADSLVVRPGAEKCDITASFVYEEQSEPALWLKENDLSYQDGEIYLRRIITAEGRSKSFINGQPFPLQKIKELSDILVYIHGQHQHHSLLQQATARQHVDQYGKHDKSLAEVASLYKQLQTVQQEIEQLQAQDQQADRITLLQFQIEELSALKLQEDEFEALQKEHQMLHHAKEFLQQSQIATSLLHGDESNNVCHLLNQILHSLEALPKEQTSIANALELINSALIQCEEAADEVEQFAERIQLDPERLHAIETRMSTIHNLARKYHVDSKQLIHLADSLQDQLNQLQSTETRLAALQQQLAPLQQAYETAAIQLRKLRQEQAPKLAQAITQIINKLGMPKGWVELEISPVEKIQIHGMDKIEYKVCTNPGMQADALHKIASGGELSRIGLAIHMITAERGSTPTLLFDEVDVGIGGNTAALVGQMLRQLGNRLQIFCVTHQPQVAACAHQHYQVVKHSDNQETLTEIHYLQAPQKVQEIARMLGGLSITEQTLSHAKELIEQSLD